MQPFKLLRELRPSDARDGRRAAGDRARRRYTSAAAVTGAVALASLLAACGSSHKSTTSNTTASSGGTTATTAASGSATTAGSGSASTGAPAANGSPILIGVDEPDRGALNLGADMTPGLNGGLNYVNKTLGGVHGHPIKLVMCDSDQTPSLEVNCANNFVAKGVVAVFDAYDAGFAAASPIIQRAGIPIFGVEVADNADDRSSADYFFGPPNEAFAVGPLQIFHNQGLNKITLTIANVPSAVNYVNLDINPVAKKLGMNVHVTYYDESTVNWSVVSNSLLSENPQATGIIAGPEGDCNSLISALRANGFKGPVLMGSCSQYVKSDPSGAVNTYSYSAGWLPSLISAAPAVVQKQIQTYNKAMSAIGQGNTEALGQWAVNSFSGLVDFHDALEAANPSSYTPATIKAALAAVSNYQSFMGPVETCDHKQWPGTSSCNHDILFVKVGPGDKYQSLEPGGFAPLDPSLL